MLLLESGHPLPLFGISQPTPAGSLIWGSGGLGPGVLSAGSVLARYIAT